MELDQRLIEKGQSMPRKGLAQEGKIHIALAEQYAAALADSGWSKEDTAALKANVETLDSAIGGQAGARDMATDRTATEARAIEASKGFIRRLRNALPRALREAKDAGVTEKSFEAGEPLGRSTPKISKYLATIRPAVAALDPTLAKHFKGEKASDVLDQVKAALDEADTAQEIARKNAPDRTLALHEMMGRVLEQIEDLNRAGKSAFDRDPSTAAKFNKDVLLRARRAARKPRPTDTDATAAAQPLHP